MGEPLRRPRGIRILVGGLRRPTTFARNLDRSRWRRAKPLWFLLLAAPLIPEVFVSHNTPPTVLLDPVGVFWLVVAYGIPILFVRELWTRRALPLASLPVLGVAYGILNEGVIAHTLAQTVGAPTSEFIGYGTVAGIHLTWATFILTWHAIHSVCVPVLLAHVLFPARAAEPWLSRRQFLASGALSGLLYATYFRGGLPAVYSTGHFLAYVVASVSLVALAVRMGRLRRAAAATQRPRFGRLVASGAFVLTLVYLAGFWAASARFPPAAVFVLAGWSGFAAFFALAHARRWEPRELLAPLLAHSVTFSLVIGLVTGSVLSFGVAAVFAVLATRVVANLRARWGGRGDGWAQGATARPPG